ncbi:hypothetical protein [Microbacterium sp. JB110]|uniref:hypothetical protein n=1 Tax=Microbacterium sp. JB110 TaxID=2024477 RepID=UPI00097E8504|nr:hypothetical protein [Microbacterium sp. JB110]SJM63591.1 hypothetical protein CZ774_12210 [Frigoribacterium sp. JB110]
MQGSEEGATPDGAAGEDGVLVSRVRVIEGQPLVERAEAYRALHTELAQRLEQAPGEA